MNAIIHAVLPLFALILLGYISGRGRLLGPAAVESLNTFVVWMALPALLFQAMAASDLHELRQPGYFLGFTLAMTIVFILGGLLRGKTPASLTLRSIEAMAAAYANVGFMGIPLMLILYGEAALAPTIIATLLTACALFAATIVLIEFDRQTSPHLGQSLMRVGLALLRNPLVFSPLAGLLLAVAGISLPHPVLQFTTLLGNAASPCALVTIGLFLAQSRPATSAGPVVRVVALKLLIHPALTAVLVYAVFDMPPLWAHTAVLLSALPVGTGPFMLAALYREGAELSSRAILVSTVLSLLTVSALVLILPASPQEIALNPY
ncbi:MAG: AEC family transporter [Castellaniella sp.]